MIRTPHLLYSFYRPSRFFIESFHLSKLVVFCTLSFLDCFYETPLRIVL